MTTESPRALAERLADPLVTGDHVRPLLDMVVQLSGLECAYLTRIDRQQNRQWVLESRSNPKDGLVIEEGMSAPWNESICKRALELGVSYTTDVASLFPPGTQGRSLGLYTYMGQPIRDRDGMLMGTLCAVSHERVPMQQHALVALTLFARLLALQIEHDRTAEIARKSFEDRAARAIDEAMASVTDRAHLERELSGVLQLHPWDLGR